MKRRFVVVIMTILISLSVIVAPVQAAEEVLHQQQTVSITFNDLGQSSYFQGNVFSTVVNGQTYTSNHAQTFTAGITGDLTKVSLQLSRYSTTLDDALAQIRTVDVNGMPTGTGDPATGGIIGSGVVDVDTVPLIDFDPEQLWVDIPLTSPAPVVSGEMYAIVLLSPSVGAAGYYGWWGTMTAPYAAGQHWSCVNYGGSACWGTFTASDGSGPPDMVFKTYVVPEGLSVFTQIAALRNEVDAFYQDGILNADEAQTLLDYLDAATADVDVEVADAIDHLNDFIDKVHDYAENGTLTETQGQELIDEAENAIGLLSS